MVFNKSLAKALRTTKWTMGATRYRILSHWLAEELQDNVKTMAIKRNKFSERTQVCIVRNDGERLNLKFTHTKRKIPPLNPQMRNKIILFLGA